MTVRIEERWNKSSFIKLGVGLALCWATGVQASSDALLNKLVQKGVLTQQEANGLREEMDKEDAQTVDLYNKTKVSSWVDEIKWYGDVNNSKARNMQSMIKPVPMKRTDSATNVSSAFELVPVELIAYPCM